MTTSTSKAAEELQTDENLSGDTGNVNRGNGVYTLNMKPTGHVMDPSSPFTSKYDGNDDKSNWQATTNPASADLNRDDGVYTLNRKPTVVDCYSVKQNALCVAVETAGMVLRIKHTIEDKD